MPTNSVSGPGSSSSRTVFEDESGDFDQVVVCKITDAIPGRRNAAARTRANDSRGVPAMALIRGGNRVGGRGGQVLVALQMGRFGMPSHSLDDDHIGVRRPLPDFLELGVLW